MTTQIKPVSWDDVHMSVNKPPPANLIGLINNKLMSEAVKFVEDPNHYVSFFIDDLEHACGGGWNRVNLAQLYSVGWDAKIVPAAAGPLNLSNNRHVLLIKRPNVKREDYST